MSDTFIDVLPYLLLILLLWGAQPIKPISDFNMDYLSLDSGKHYRGVLAVAIILHHLSQKTTTGAVFPFFATIGYLAVSIFFFISGYGLQRSHMSNPDKYRKGFLRRRMPAILIPYFIIAIVSWIVFYICGDTYTFTGFLATYVNGHPFVIYSWYVICILAFYIFFWLLMTVCKKHYFIMILFACVYCAAYAAICIKLNYGSWWYHSSHLLVIGMIWATYEKQILKFITKKPNYRIITPITVACFLFMFYSRRRIIALMSFTGASLPITLIIATLFTFNVLMFFLKVRVDNKVLSFLGDISYEMYITQGLFVYLFRSEYIYIENDLLWSIAVIAGAIISSYFLHMASTLIIKKHAPKNQSLHT